MLDFNNPLKIFLNSSLGYLFEDPSSARLRIPDLDNYYMFQTLWRDYIKWHETNHHFHPEYQANKSHLNLLGYLRWAWTGAGVLLAGMVINPNYTKPRSFYLRKFNVFFFAWVGYQYGNKNYLNYEANMLLRMNDYFPLEVKRSLRTEDYRYLALFNYENSDRQLFDTTTGKALS